MLVTSVGRGLYVPASVLYFRAELGLSANQIGLALAFAGAGALLGAPRLGAVVDRARRPRNIAVAYGLAHSAAMVALLAADTYTVFIAVVAVLGAVERGSSVARQALVALLFPPSERVLTQARLRTVANVGISAGALLAALAMASGSVTGYGLLIAGNGVALLCLALLLLRLPPAERPATEAEPPEWHAVLHDRPFLTVVLLNGGLSLHGAILNVGLPLWVTLRIGAPVWLVPALYATNTVLTVLLQVRAAGRAGTPAEAADVLRWSGLFTAAACLTMLVSAWLPLSAAVAVLVAGVVLLTAGEVTQAAGGWGLAYGLIRGRSEGAYLGAFSMGTGLQDLAGPLIVTAVLVGQPVAGPLITAAALTAVAFAVPRVFHRSYSRQEVLCS
ncbi:MFS transporter [Nucisporomicrobium flavum]|uniref:MFS transporter n=1 Tax=Nucisporomicrobium flavum TaxID=2785915 RepID=UPI0018F2ED92|nr:MFS transporter [Nucisporomicrobium flavum]